MSHNIYNGRGLDQAILRDITQSGLVGRQEQHRATHPNRPSVEGLVYLIHSAPQLYAIHNAERRNIETCAIFEIDFSKLDLAKLFPDEDYLFLAAQDGDIPIPCHELTTSPPRLDPRQYAELTETSLVRLGNAAFDDAIPLEHISRIALFRRSSRLTDWILAADNFQLSTASALNQFHSAVLRFFLDGTQIASDLLPPTPSIYCGRVEAFQDDVASARASRDARDVLAQPPDGWVPENVARFLAEFESREPPGML